MSYRGSNPQVQQILQECGYTQLAHAKSHIANAMVHYGNLKPTRELFTLPDRTQKYLLCLAGTIPVSYRGSIYNIPVAMFLLPNYPAVAPYCYVRPTSTMQVRPGRNVDGNGMIYLPYLSEWKQGTHDLTSLVQIMCVVFGECPPVVSTQQNYPRGPPATTYQPPSNLPYPMANSSHMPYPTSQPSGYPNTTPYPQAHMPPQNAMPYPPTGHMPQQIPDDAIKASLKSAVNDKLKRRMKDTRSQADMELSSLRETEGVLRDRQRKLQELITRLENEIDKTDSNIVVLKGKNEEMETKIQEMQGKQEDLDVDEVVFPATPLYKQILESFAEEQALEDTIFYLGEALRKGSVDLESFLKHVRSLSRQQFVVTATIMKARSTAQLTNAF